MRNFVIKYGSFVVNIAAFLTIIGLIFSTVKVTVYQGVMAGLAVFWAGLVSFIFVYFLIYLVMSLNEHVISINEKLNGRY